MHLARRREEIAEVVAQYERSAAAGGFGVVRASGGRTASQTLVAVAEHMGEVAVVQVGPVVRVSRGWRAAGTAWELASAEDNRAKRMSATRRALEKRSSRFERFERFWHFRAFWGIFGLPDNH